jgi:hypothetical protein
MLMLTTSTAARGLQEAMTIRPTTPPMRDNHTGQDSKARPAQSRRVRFGLAIAAVK